MAGTDLFAEFHIGDAIEILTFVDPPVRTLVAGVVPADAHLSSAVRAVEQAGQRMHIPGLVSFPLTDGRLHFPALIPELLCDDWLVGIVDRDHLLWLAEDFCLVFVRYRGRALLNKMSEISGIVEHLLYRVSRPKMMGASVVGRAELLLLVVGRNEYLLFIEDRSDPIRTHSLCSQLEHTEYVTRCRFVSYRESLFIISCDIPIRSKARTVLREKPRNGMILFSLL